LKVSAQDSSDAHVQCEELDAPIYIYGSRNRNRALDGDEVAIELVSVDDMMHEKKAKLEARRMRRMSSGHPLQPFTEESNQVGERPKYCGKVVCILERPRNMLFAG
jgi:exoribonuclease R